MSFVNGNVYINNLYGLSHTFTKTSYLPSTSAGQTVLFVSDGTIPGTIDGDVYLVPFGGAPINLSQGGTLQDVDNVGIGTGLIFKDVTSSTVNLRSLVAGVGINISTVGDDIFIVNTGSAGGVGYEDLATSSMIDPDPNLEITDFNVNTGTEVTLTLDDPSPPVPGTKKKLIVSRITGGSSLMLNIPSLINGTSLQFNTLGMSASLVFCNPGWAIDITGANLIP